MSKKRFLPFGWSPSHWGLTGKLREAARANHELEGEELERRWLEINLADRTDKEMARVALDIDKKYGKITDEEYDRKVLESRSEILSPKEKELEELDIDKKYGNVSNEDYDKRRATILDEPYVNFTKIHTDPKNPASGSVALDYNKAFVQYLEDNGYGPAPTDDEIVDRWFTELCKNIALDAFDGIGDFNERLDEHEARNPDIIYKRDLDPEKKER